MIDRNPPSNWKVEKFADVGASEPFVNQFLELFDILGATLIRKAEKERVENAIGTVLTDGLMPTFLELRSIRASVGKDLPLVDRYQLYEDFARKLWKSYKDLMQRAAKEMGFDIGFLFQKDGKFEAGLKRFRAEYANAPESLEDYLREVRRLWQNDLSKFRNEFLEHREGDRSEHLKFYDARFAESLFKAVWTTIIEILVMLMSLRLPPGIFVVDPGPDNKMPGSPKRFGWEIARQIPPSQ